MKYLFIFTLLFSCLVANQFGNGIDGNLTIPLGTTHYIDEVKTAVTSVNTQGSDSLSIVSSSGFSINDEIVIIIVQDGSGSEDIVGLHEFNRIIGMYDGGFILESPLQRAYDASGNIIVFAQKVPNYTTLEVYGELTCSDWNGTSGGLIIFRAADEVTSSH